MSSPVPRKASWPPPSSPLLERPPWRLLENAQDMVYRYRIFPSRGMEYVAGAVFAITGHTASEFYDDPDLPLKAVHPDDRHLLWLGSDRPPPSTAPVTMRWLHSGGRVVYAEHRRVPVHDRASGMLTAVEGIARDVTERVIAQQRLRDSEEQLRRLAASLETAREEERAALARELHDELGQTLTALKLEIGRTAAALEGVPSPPVMDRLQSLVGLVDIGVAMVSRITTRLRPPALDHLGLAEAIRWEAATFRARSGLRCHVSGGNARTRLTTKQQTALFRILQEALTNIVRHAQASAVRIRLREARRAFELRIGDNGRGITSAEAADVKATGLLGMRERAAQAGGSLEIAGGPRRGTAVTVTVPLPAITAKTRRPRARPKRRRAR
jgi:two-component system sensor histidine kinase UhpB